MKSISTKIFIIISVFNLAFFSLILEAKANYDNAIADRLVLDVKNTSYTQRQVEGYFIIKEILSRSSNSKNLPSEIDSSNWETILNSFRIDMIIDIEALRLGSFNLSSDALNQGLKLFKNKINTLYNGQNTKSYNWQVLQSLSENDQLKLIASVLRVEAFKRSKNRLIETSLEQSSWISELEKRITYRYFDNARQYILLKKNY